MEERDEHGKVPKGVEKHPNIHKYHRQRPAVHAKQMCEAFHLFHYL